MSTEAISPIQAQEPIRFEARTRPSGEAVAPGAANDAQPGTPRSDPAVDSDDVVISPEARRAAEGAAPEAASVSPTDAPGEADRPVDETNAEEDDAVADEETELTEEDQDQVRKLKARDIEVRNHEAAHLRTAGSHALGGANFEYQRGPDGKQYAVGGHVNIDVGEVPGDPEATLAKAQQIRRAALAPAEPSGKDRQVAAQASALIINAQKEIRQEAIEGPSDEAGASEPKDAEPPGLEPPDLEPPDTVPPTDGTELFDGFQPLAVTTGAAEPDPRAAYGIGAYTANTAPTNAERTAGGISLIA